MQSLEQKNLTQTELGERLGVSYKAVSNGKTVFAYLIHHYIMIFVTYSKLQKTNCLQDVEEKLIIKIKQTLFYWCCV